MSPNRYEVLGKIADGGLGSVYKAYDRNLRREVALKRVRADSPEQASQQAEQLMEEARNLSALQHPHIVTIFDVGRDEEGAYIVMELLKGETLENIIERGALAEADFRQLVAQSLEGLVAAHSSGMIHLDIKPQNFMVIWLPSGKFQIKILDFGLAKISSQPALQEMDDDGSIMGSIFFMAPEQFERAPVDARTDLYSLGCVYYFALTQHYPFQGETGPEVMASHLYHSFVPLSHLRPDLPPFICQWVEWLMGRLPDQRPVTSELAYEIFQNGAFPQAEASTPVEPQHVETDTQGVPVSRPAAPRAPKPVIHRPGTATGQLSNRPVPKPIVRPVNIAAAMAPSHLRHKKKLPKWLVFGVPAAIVAVVAVIFIIQAVQSSQRNARFNSLLTSVRNSESPSGTTADVRLLLDFIDQKETSEDAGKVLARLKDVEGSNSLITQRISSTKNSWAVLNLARVASERKINDAVVPLTGRLSSSTEQNVRQAIWSALAQLGTAGDIPSFLDKIKGAPSEELRLVEPALVNASRSEPDPARRGTDILRLLEANSVGDDEQAMLVKTLCRIGNPNALPVILKALRNQNNRLRYAAAAGLGDWPTAEPVTALLELLSIEKDSFTRLNAITSLGNLALLSGEVPQTEIAAALTKDHWDTKDPRARTQIVKAMAKVVDPLAISFFEDLAARDPKQNAKATAAAKAITTMLNKAMTPGDQATPLSAAQATLTPGPLVVKNGVIMNWLGEGDHVSWLVKIDKPGAYDLQMTYASAATQPGRCMITFGKEAFIKQLDNTGGNTSFRTINIGGASFPKPGFFHLWIRPLEIPQNSQLMQLKEVVITARP